MDELVRWLGEQLDKDERIAQGADPGPWKNNSLGRHDQSVIKLGPPTSTSLIQFDGSRAAANGTHVARHDPARVLRDIEAKREVVRLAERAHDYHETFMNGFAAALEGTLRLFALAYADRPGYRRDWRP